jgi:hypothetical protein
MSNCSTERRLFRPFRTNMNKLMIISGVGEIIDTRLVNLNSPRR